MAKQRATKKEKAGPKVLPPPPEIKGNTFEDAGVSNQLKQAKTVAEVRRIKLQTEILEGKLVSKELVYNDLFKFSSLLKARFYAIPDQVVDMVMNAKDRAKAFKILMEAIDDALEELTDVEGLMQKFPFDKKENHD